MARSGIGLASATLTAGLVGYVFNLVLTRALGPEAYGGLGALLGVGIIASVSATALQLEVARAAARPDGVRTREALRWAAFVALGTGAVALLGVPVLEWSLRLPQAIDAVLLAVLLVPQTLSGGVQGLALGRGRFGAYAVLLVLSAGSRLAAAALTALGGHGATYALAASAVGALLVATGGAAWVAGPGSRDPRAPRGAPVASGSMTNREWTRGLLRAGSGAGALMVLLNVDLLVSRSVLDAQESGWYAFLTIFGRVTFWGTSFLSLWIFPRVAATGSAGRALRTALGFIGVAGGLAFLSVLVAGRPLVALLAGPDYAGSEVAAPWFALIGMLLAVVQLATYVDVARSRHQLSWWVWGSAALVAALVLGLRLDSITSIAATTTAVLGVLTVVGLRMTRGVTTGSTAGDRPGRQ